MRQLPQNWFYAASCMAIHHEDKVVECCSGASAAPLQGGGEVRCMHRRGCRLVTCALRVCRGRDSFLRRVRRVRHCHRQPGQHVWHARGGRARHVPARRHAGGRHPRQAREQLEPGQHSWCVGGGERLEEQQRRTPDNALIRRPPAAGARTPAAHRDCGRRPDRSACPLMEQRFARHTRPPARPFPPRVRAGVEFAGELADFVNHDLKKIDPDRARDMRVRRAPLRRSWQLGSSLSPPNLCRGSPAPPAPFVPPPDHAHRGQRAARQL